MTASSKVILETFKDEDLKERLKVLAPTIGMTSFEAEAAWERIITCPVEPSGKETVASVYGKAKSEYEQKLANLPDRPGLDPNVVADNQLLYAIKFFVEESRKAEAEEIEKYK